jgi:hypothetical protein
MKKYSESIFLKAFFVLLVALPGFTMFCPTASSGQTVQPKQDTVLVAFAPEPTSDRVRGMTPRRLWATSVAVVGLIGLVVGAWALRQSSDHDRTGKGRTGAIVALALGLIAIVNGGLNLAFATGGPGSGNGIIGGVAALVLGLIALILGVLARRRSDPT